MVVFFGDKNRNATKRQKKKHEYVSLSTCGDIQKIINTFCTFCTIKKKPGKYTRGREVIMEYTTKADTQMLQSYFSRFGESKKPSETV